MVESLFLLYLYVLRTREYAKNLSWGQHETIHIVIFDKKYLFKTLSPGFFAMHLLLAPEHSGILRILVGLLLGRIDCITVLSCPYITNADILLYIPYYILNSKTRILLLHRTICKDIIKAIMLE